MSAPLAEAVRPPRPAQGRRLAGQGAMLAAAFGIGQGLSLLRNALLGHALSRGDFGTAATITLALQMIEILSDVGADRYIVQSVEGDTEQVQAAAHGVQVLRGMLTALLLVLGAGPIAAFFHVPEAAWAFQLAALAPLVRGFAHLDPRRLQRRYDSRAFIAVEVVPQAIATALIVPALMLIGGYAAATVVLVLQALIGWLLSLWLADRPYRLSFDPALLRRIFAFGWPIWLSAIPLMAVYQGERVIVGRMFGVEALAAFTVAFMTTMVPGLLAAKIGQSLMLPLLAEARPRPARFLRRVRILCEVTTIGAAVYAVLFLVAGELLLPVLFGPAYADLGPLVACLALMWTLRMIQAVPGMTVMALGETRPLLVAGLIRASALPAALALALAGASLPAVVAAGIAGEIGALVYIGFAAGRLSRGVAGLVLGRSLFLAPVCALAALLDHALPPSTTLITHLALVVGLTAAVVMAGFALMPGVRRFVDIRRLRPKRVLPRLAVPA